MPASMIHAVDGWRVRDQMPRKEYSPVASQARAMEMRVYAEREPKMMRRVNAGARPVPPSEAIPNASGNMPCGQRSAMMLMARELMVKP